MGNDKSLKELERALRKSKRRLPFDAVFATIFVAALWAVHVSSTLPRWIVWFGVVLGLFTPVSEGINLISCRSALRRLDLERAQERLGTQKEAP